METVRSRVGWVALLTLDGERNALETTPGPGRVRRERTENRRRRAAGVAIAESGTTGPVP